MYNYTIYTMSQIDDLNEDLVKMKLQVAIIQKTIKILGGEIEDNYCYCGIHNNLCDDLCYDHLDDVLKKIFTRAERPPSTPES